MLKERGKWLHLRLNILNILENKRNVEWMLKQSLRAFKLFQHRFNILSKRFNNIERRWQTLSTLPFNKIERMLKQMLKPFPRAFRRLRSDVPCVRVAITIPSVLNHWNHDLLAILEKRSESWINFICWSFYWFYYPNPNSLFISTSCLLMNATFPLSFLAYGMCSWPYDLQESIWYSPACEFHVSYFSLHKIPALYCALLQLILM